MISKIYTKDWFGRTEKDYVFDMSDMMKGIVQIPNHKYSSFLYSENKAEKICSDDNLLAKELLDMTHAIGLSTISLRFSEDNPTACTNGSYIEIGMGDDYKAISDCYEKLDRVIGMVIHESCHCLYTDFNYANNELINKPSIIHYIHNVIEDEIIEENLILNYPGYQNFLNKLKYNLFEKNKDADETDDSELNDILKILFYLIRYPKFISEIDEDVLGKYENLFAEIKKIMHNHGCFIKNNSFPTKSSVGAAFDIYELLKDKIKEASSKSSSDKNSNSNEPSENEVNDSEDKGQGNKKTDIHILDKDNPIFNEQDELKMDGSGGNILTVMSKIYDEMNSSSERVDVSEIIVYHDEIENNVNNFKEFKWEECPDININNDDIKIHKIEDKNKYNSYKNDVSKFIKDATNLIINNKKKTEVINTRFNRSGSLDPNRLTNAMCNEQTVYIRKQTKTVDNEPEYALGIIVDESGSMTDHGINILASKITIMLYEAMCAYPKIKLFVYGHGDTIYKYIDLKTCKNKYVLGNRKQQWGQDEIRSYKVIVNDIKSQTKLPIILFNITDSCYCSNPNALKELTEELKEDKKQKTYINMITLSHNENVTRSVKNWNDLIYGEGNWVIYNNTSLTPKFTNIIKQISEIIHRTIKL